MIVRRWSVWVVIQSNQRILGIPLHLGGDRNMRSMFQWWRLPPGPSCSPGSAFRPYLYISIFGLGSLLCPRHLVTGLDQFSISYKIPLSTYFGLSEIACWSVLCVACHWVCIYMNIYTEHSIYGFCLSFVIYDEKFGQISISQQLRSSHYPSSPPPAGPP